MSAPVAGLAWRSLRHRATASTATFVTILMGSALMGSFATLAATATSSVSAADRDTLTTMGVVVGSWGAVIVLFAVANRAPVVVSLDPFSGENSALAFSVPLFIVMIGCTIIGLLIGGIASLSHRYRMWRAIRHAEAEAARHKQDAENERRLRQAVETPAPQFPELSPPP